MIDVSRRDFFRMAAAAAPGTALGGLVGLGAALGPAVARAQELRIRIGSRWVMRWLDPARAGETGG